MSTPHNVLRPTFGRRPQRDRQQELQPDPQPDPNDAIMEHVKMLVAKSDALIGVERTNQTLPARIDLALAARWRKP